MKKILIISPYIPWPLRSGGNVGVYYLLSYIQEYLDAHFVTQLNKNNKECYIEELKENLPKVHFHLYDYKKTKNKKFEILRKIKRRISQRMFFSDRLSSYSLDIMDQVTPGYVDFVNNIIEKSQIDIVQIEFCGYLPFVYTLPNHVKKVFIHHELGFVRDELDMSKKRYGQMFINFRKDNEIAMLNRFDQIVSMTDIDKKKMIEIGVKKPIHVSTSSISNKTYDQHCGICEERMTFIGGSGHFPNYNGIQWFVSHVLPIVKQMKPDFKLQIIGKWSEDCINEIKKIDSDVEFLGFVDDLQKVVANSIMVVPILIGSGIRMKILEAANFSVPFVSTVVGVEGLNFENGTECIITDDEHTMARGIISLYEDKKLYEGMSKNVHEKFVALYSFEALGQKRLSLYD